MLAAGCGFHAVPSSSSSSTATVLLALGGGRIHQEIISGYSHANSHAFPAFAICMVISHK